MTAAPSLGRRLADAAPAERFALHAQGDRSAFAAHDAVVATLVDRMLRGERVLQAKPAASRTSVDQLHLVDVGSEERAALDAVLTRSLQEGRGAWYLPDAEKLLVGVTQQAYWAKLEPRYALSAADADRAAVPLTTTDAITAWAVLQPIAEDLWLPLKLRSGTQLGSRKPDLVAKDWIRTEATYAALGIDPGPLDAYRDPTRWADRTRDEILAIREALLAAWAATPSDVGQRAIAWHIDQLVTRYYAKAKVGRAERAKVLDKTTQRSLTAAFGGDWLAFVAYIGEQVHDAETITTAVEATSFVASGRERAAQAAAATGIPAEEVERVLAAYWDGAGMTPVEQRVDLIRRWWTAFDEIHAGQRSGLPSLWGLSDDGGHEDSAPWIVDDGRKTPRIHEAVGDAIVEEIRELWGTAMLPRWPDRLVTEPLPVSRLATTVGDALSFWEGIALTCWFICEGPYSRTDIANASSYYDRQLKALDDMGCPVDRTLFRDLLQAQKQLAERPAEREDVHEAEGFSISFSMGPTRYDGFEQLRDVVTSHRRAWAEKHLDDYLRSIWQRPLRACGDAYHRQVAQNGKAPTAKQFAKIAAPVANAWFAGDLTKLSDALGLQSGDEPTHVRRLPARAGFTAHLRQRLGGQRWELQPEDLPEEARPTRLRRAELADRGAVVVQTWEATGALPTLTGNAWAKGYLEEAYGPDIEAGWAWFVAHVVATVRELAPELILADDELPTSPPASPPLAARARPTNRRGL